MWCGRGQFIHVYLETWGGDEVCALYLRRSSYFRPLRRPSGLEKATTRQPSAWHLQNTRTTFHPWKCLLHSERVTSWGFCWSGTYCNREANKCLHSGGLIKNKKIGNIWGCHDGQLTPNLDISNHRWYVAYAKGPNPGYELQIWSL